MEKPYIISGEFDLSNTPQQTIIRSEKLAGTRRSLTEELQGMGKNVTWIEAAAIADGINAKKLESTLPTISLEEIYTTAPDGRLGISRGTDSTFSDTEYQSRAGYDTTTEQLDQIASLGREVQLVDDVVFSGEMMTWVIEELGRRRTLVSRVIAGIAIKEGIERLNAIDVPVEAVFTFDDVEDEICERDLFLSRGSGRRLNEGQGSALYFDDIYGKPTTWASIPEEYQQSFCLNSLERSLQLLQPGVPMSAIGQFLGYSPDDTAQESVRKRLTEAS